MNEAALIAQLRAALGAGDVLTEAHDRAPFETDWRGIMREPALAAVLPRNTAQVASVVKICAAAGAAIVPQGGNTGLVAGGVPCAGKPQIVLNLRRMTAVRALDAAGGTMIVEAGATLHAVQVAAAAAGWLFPVSLGAEGTAQIGGIISTNAGGVQVLSYGSARAQVLGLEIVLADGRVWDGLRALRKDNTGFDLKQLFIGAEGTLGIITAASLRMHPAVRARVTALAGVASAIEAFALFQRLAAAAGESLTLCEFIAGAAMALGAAYAPADARVPFAAPAYVLVELSAYQTGQDPPGLLEEIMSEALSDGLALDAVFAQSEQQRLNLMALRDAVPEGELREGGAVKHDIAVPVALMPEMVAAVEALVRADFPDCRLNIFGHIGDGNLHINVRPPPGQKLADLAPRKAQITCKIEALAMARGGSFSAEHGVGQLRLDGMRAHKSAVELDLMRAVKAALDPAGLFNPGKMIPPCN